MSRQIDVNGIKGEKVTVAPGATLALLVEPIGGQLSYLLKYASGGSLELIQAPQGMSFGGATTWAGASLAALIGTGYLMGTTEAVNLDGPVRYYLMATGATTICYSIRGLSQGF